MKSSKRQVEQLGIVFGLVAVVLLAVSIQAHPIELRDQQIWLILPALALLAEFMPVPIAEGINLTFSLPYIAGMAVAANWTTATFTDLSVTLLAGIAVMMRRYRNISLGWLSINCAISVISASFAGIIYAAAKGALDNIPGTTSLTVLAFMFGYASANVLLIHYMEELANHEAGESILQKLKENIPGTALYMMVGLAVAVLVKRNLMWVVPLTLVPIWSLRTALMLRGRMYDQYYETISALALMLQRAHPYTHGHLERVARLSEQTALRLGLTPHRARLVREASVLHDIGKIAVDESILDKPGKLDEKEFEHIKKHSVLGAAILAPVEPFRELVTWIRHHHERPDGTGYPDGLSEDQIPIESRIIAVVDAFDAMTGGEDPAEKRSYREPMTQSAALDELERCSGTQFDGRVVSIFRDLVQKELA